MSTLSTYQSGAGEFRILSGRFGIDPSVMVDPRTELSFAVARRRCSNCAAKQICRIAMRRPHLHLRAVAAFCPNADVLVELMGRQPGSRA
jgi:hypothetical protein